MGGRSSAHPSRPQISDPVRLDRGLGLLLPLWAVVQNRVPGWRAEVRLNGILPRVISTVHDTGSTTARSVDEVALIRDTISHYAPVLIAPLSNLSRRRVGGIFSAKIIWKPGHKTNPVSQRLASIDAAPEGLPASRLGGLARAPTLELARE